MTWNRMQVWFLGKDLRDDALHRLSLPPWKQIQTWRDLPISWRAALPTCARHGKVCGMPRVWLSGSCLFVWLVGFGPLYQIHHVAQEQKVDGGWMNSGWIDTFKGVIDLDWIHISLCKFWTNPFMQWLPFLDMGVILSIAPESFSLAHVKHILHPWSLSLVLFHNFNTVKTKRDKE